MQLRRGHGGGGWGGNLDCPYNTWNGVEIRDIPRYFSSADWDALFFLTFKYMLDANTSMESLELDVVTMAHARDVDVAEE